MKTTLLRAALLAVLALVAVTPSTSADKQLLVPDTPTVLGTTPVLMGQIAVYDPDTQTYSVDTSLTIPGSPPVNAIHKLSNPGQFLFSTTVPQAFNGADPDPLAVAVGQSVEYADIIRYDGVGTYSRFFCNNAVGTDMLPAGIGIDAIYIDGSDSEGDLIISLTAAADLASVVIGGQTYEQNDLLRYRRTAPGCGNWDLTGFEFDAGHIPTGASQPLIEPGVNVVGATRDGDRIFLAFDVPSTLAASAYNPYNPHVGELATWNVATQSFSLAGTLIGWPTPQTGSAAFANALAAPPPSCTGLGSPDVGDEIVDLCGATWATDDSVRRFRIEWLPLAGGTQYNVLRGMRSDLTPSGLTMCIASQTLANYYVEASDPPLGEGYFYLIQKVGGPLECNNAPGCGGGCCARVIIPQGNCP